MSAPRRISRRTSPIRRTSRRRRSISGGRKSDKVPNKPSYKDQIKAALLALKEFRTGTSLPNIKKFLGASPAQYRYINAALRSGVASGFFIKNKGKYKLSPEAKKGPKKKKKKKKKKKALLKKCSDNKIRSGDKRCRPGPRTPCRDPEKRRKLSQRKTKRGGKVYECVKKKRRRKSKK